MEGGKTEKGKPKVPRWHILREPIPRHDKETPRKSRKAPLLCLHRYTTGKTGNNRYGQHFKV